MADTWLGGMIWAEIEPADTIGLAVAPVVVVDAGIVAVDVVTAPVVLVDAGTVPVDVATPDAPAPAATGANTIRAPEARAAASPVPTTALDRTDFLNMIP